MLNKKKNTKGFSLIELVVTASIFLILVVLSGQLIRLAGFDSQVNSNLNEVQQNARVGLKFLERDITNNGDNFLIGLSSGNLIGPLISLEAFKTIRGTNGKNGGKNVPINPLNPMASPVQESNRQPFFSLLPVRRADNLGNGADTFPTPLPSTTPTPLPGKSAAENGSSDRLTVAYEDEFFVAGTQTDYGTDENPATAATNKSNRDNATAPGTGAFTVNNDEEFEGFWTRPPNSATPGILTLPPKDPKNTNLAGVTTYSRIFYSVDNIKVGDIFKLTNANGNEVIAIVSKVNLPGANQLTNPPSLEFKTDALKINKASTSAVINTVDAAIKALDPINDPNFDSKRNALLEPLYPLDFLPLAPGDVIPTGGAKVKATKALLFTYLVNTDTKDLIRRRYTYKESTDPVGVAFIDDPVCQNVDRFWVSFNLIVAANPPTTLVPSLANEVELDPDNDQTDYSKLQNIRRVNINLILRSTEIDRRTLQPSRVGIQASFAPRNIVYQLNESAR